MRRTLSIVSIAIVLILVLISGSAASADDATPTPTATPTDIAAATSAAEPTVVPTKVPTTTPLPTRTPRPKPAAKPAAKPTRKPAAKPGGSAHRKPATKHPRRPVRRQPTLNVPRGWPRYLQIPKIKVNASVEAIALRNASDFKAPYRWGDVAWYDLGPRPGDMGRANIFGHLDSTCCAAVFWQLRLLKAGDVAYVQYKTGKAVPFRILWSATYPNAKVPMKWLYANARERGLVLMTCTGVFHRDGTGYDHKLVVYGRAILPNGHLG